MSAFKLYKKRPVRRVRRRSGVFRRCAAAFLPVWLCLLPLGACGAEPLADDTFFAMDTVFEVRAPASGLSDFAAAARAETARLESLFSATDAGSELSALNAAGGGAVSDETAALLRRALDFAAQTGGAFDPTVRPLLLAWGWTGGTHRVPSSDELAAALARVGADRVSVAGTAASLGGAELDLGGIAKGYAADRMFALAEEQGLASACVTLGGMVAAVGARPDGSPWRIGVTAPEGDGLAAVLAVRDVCLSTSGGYQRCFEENGRLWHHILDPRTGYPAESGLKSVTVVDRDGTRADALSTALFVMGRGRAEAFCAANGVCALLITDENELVPLGGAEALIVRTGPAYPLASAPAGG